MRKKIQRNIGTKELFFVLKICDVFPDILNFWTFIKMFGHISKINEFP